MAEDWRQHLISAEYALDNLTHDQVSTVAKMMALQVGSYIKSHGVDELEALENFVNATELDEEAKEIFVLGMQALLEVVRQIEMSGAERH
jgi:hypothetical protein